MIKINMSSEYGVLNRPTLTHNEIIDTLSIDDYILALTRYGSEIRFVQAYNVHITHNSFISPHTFVNYISRR